MAGAVHEETAQEVASYRKRAVHYRHTDFYRHWEWVTRAVGEGDALRTVEGIRDQRRIEAEIRRRTRAGVAVALRWWRHRRLQTPLAFQELR
jgi:hypothetical protein